MGGQDRREGEAVEGRDGGEGRKGWEEEGEWEGRGGGRLEERSAEGVERKDVMCVWRWRTDGEVGHFVSSDLGRGPSALVHC